MRILQLVYAFYPPYSESGNSRVAYEISKELARKGHDVTVCTTNVLSGERMFYPKKDVYNINGIKVHYQRNLFYKPHAFIPLFYSQGVVHEIRKNIVDYDVIHIHENRFYTSILLHHYAKKHRIPYVLQAHGDLPMMTKQSMKILFDYFWGRKLLKDASKTVALNNTEADQYRSMGVSENKIAVIPNGINLSEYADLPPKGSFKKKFGIRDDERIVLYLGRIHKIKGVDVLAKAFASFRKEFRNDRLVFVGPDDGFLDELKALIKSLQIEREVLIAGPLYGRDKLEAYVDADVYVLPSRYDIFPMSLLEAYACAKPVICSAVSGLRDLVIDGLTGLLFEPGNAKQLESSLRFFLDDIDRGVTMGIRGKLFVEKNYSIEKAVDRLEQLYEEAIAN